MTTTDQGDGKLHLQDLLAGWDTRAERGVRRNPLGTEWKEQCVGQKEQPVWRLRGENELRFLKDQKGEGQCGWGRATRTNAEAER